VKKVAGILKAVSWTFWSSFDSTSRFIGGL
jgi:hypothetical protein